MNNEATKICILGGGFGGLYTAIYLSSFSWVKSGKCQITLVEQKDNFLFSPLLYEILTGELQRWEIAPSYQKLLANTNIHFCQDKIENVDLQSRQVKLEKNQPLTYDYLVLAVGTKNKFVDIPGLATHALTFRTLADTENLQERLTIMEASGRQRLRIAIIGGGPNGVELACKLADRLQRRVEVSLIERGNEILKNFNSGVKTAAKKALKKRHIQVKFETNVSAIAADNITIASNNQTITLPVDLVLWTAGTEAIEWVYNLDCPKNGGGKLITRPTLQLVEYPEVLALGDLAEIHNGQTLPATAQVAYQQASCAAKNLKAALLGKRLKRFRYLHLGDMLTLGKGDAIVSSFFLNITGSLGAILRRLIYIFRLPTMRHRIQVLKNLLFS